MGSLLEWGVDVVLWFQQFSPALDLWFKFFSFTGDEMFYLLFLPVIFWCINRHFGIRLMILFLFSNYINSVAKMIVDQPRPFNFDTRIKAIVHATGGGLPSGHTQNALIFWGYLASCFKRKWLWTLAVIMIIFVPMSRVYLGVHFPTDLIGGYILGIIVLLLFMKLGQPVIDWIKQKSLSLQLVLSFLIPVFLVMIMPSADPIGISVCGVLMVGIIILLVFYIGLKKAFIGLEPKPVFRFIRYTIIGLHFTFLGPLVFVKLKLATAKIC
ncbi:MAG: phosphatase PAP2 family protein [Desulfobacteraceae bacterium]|nr:phosphatase PAP2 family protein [Desulfobacteraceae bacterium]